MGPSGGERKGEEREVEEVAHPSRGGNSVYLYILREDRVGVGVQI